MPRELPHDDTAERIVLGCMMTTGDPADIEAITDRLNSEAFYRPRHQVIYAHLVAAWAEGQPTEPTALTARLSAAGELPRTGGAPYLAELVEAVPVAAQAGHYAQLVAEAADQRRLAEAADRLAAAAEISDPAARTERVEAIRADLAGTLPGGPTRAEPLDWPGFLTREFGPVDFLAGRLLTAGQQVALVGDGKAGKSLFAQEWAWRIAAGLGFLDDSTRPPLRVLYVDQENTAEDIQERFLSLGATADTLRNLTYLSFPAFRPLNTAAGGADLLAAIARHRPAVVFLDTISRMVRGKENEADTWLDLYRYTLLPLKARTISTIRLDHFGKDATRGSRGNSAKTQDVDAVWELVPVERGASLLDLTRTHTRSGKGPDRLLIRRHGEQIGDRWKPGASWHGIAGEHERPDTTPDPDSQYKPAARRVLGVLGGADHPLTVTDIGDRLAGQPDGPLKRRTIQDALSTLADAGEVDALDQGRGKAGLWQVADR